MLPKLCSVQITTIIRASTQKMVLANKHSFKQQSLASVLLRFLLFLNYLYPTGFALPDMTLLGFASKIQFHVDLQISDKCG